MTMRRAAARTGLEGKDGGKASPAPASSHAQRPPAGNQARLRKLERGGSAEVAADRLADQALREPEGVPAAPPKRASARPSLPGDLPKPVYRALAGSGQALAPTVRESFEAGFGADLNAVRVHAGPSAATAASSVAAQAFASGSDIVFGEGRYRPDTASGRRLLAHELAHVVLGQAVPGHQGPDGLRRESLGTAEILKRISAIETQMKSSSLTPEAETALFDELESLQQQLADAPVAQAAAKVTETKKRIQAVEQKLDTTSQTAKDSADLWEERDQLSRDLSDREEDLRDETGRDGRISRTHALMKDSDEDLKKLYLKVLTKSPESRAKWEGRFDWATFEQIVEARFGDQGWYLDKELERLQSATGDERDRLYYHRLARAVPTPTKAADLIPMLKEAEWWAETDGSYSGMLHANEILTRIRDWLDRVASDENLDNHFRGLPFMDQARTFPGAARTEMRSLVARMNIVHNLGPARFGGYWAKDLTILGAAQTYLEVLNDEKKLDDTSIPALHHSMRNWAYVDMGALAALPVAVAGGGLAVEGGAALAALGETAWTSANLAATQMLAWGATVPGLGWLITNPDKSIPIGMFTANQAAKIYQMGIRGYLESLTTPEGFAGLMLDLGEAAQMHYDLRATPQPEPGTALAALRSSGTDGSSFEIVDTPSIDANGVGQVSVRHRPTGAVVSLTLDPNENLVHVYDQNGNGFRYSHDFGGDGGVGAGAGAGAGPAPSNFAPPPGRVIDVDSAGAGGGAPPFSNPPPGAITPSGFVPPTPTSDTFVELPASPDRYVTPNATPANPNPHPVAMAPDTGTLAMQQRYNDNPNNIQYHENARVARTSRITIAPHADASPPGDLVSSARGSQAGAPGQANTTGSVIPDGVGTRAAPPGQGPVAVEVRLHSENPHLQTTMPNAQSANNPTLQINRNNWYLDPDGNWVNSNNHAAMGPVHMPVGGRDRGPTGLGEIPGMAADQGPPIPGAARPPPDGFTMSSANPMRDDGTPSSQLVNRWGRPGDNLNGYDIDEALSGLRQFLKPYRPTPLLPDGGGPGPAPGPGGGGGGGPLTIVEPYAGPSLASATDLQARHPGALVIAGEGRIQPSADVVSIFQAGGGVFHPEGLPPLPHLVDQVRIRFPLPNHKGSEIATSDYLRGVPLDQAMARAETLHNAGPYALQNLRPDGTVEVVFYEQDIINDVDALTQIRFDGPDGNRYGFEIVSQSEGRVGDIAPFSGFGIVENRDAVVSRVILRKIPRRP